MLVDVYGQMQSGPVMTDPAQSYFTNSNPNAAGNSMFAGGNATGNTGNLSSAWGSVNGFVNDTFGGWGGAMQAIGQLANIYGGIQQIGLAKDQLGLARDSFNFNTSLARKNLENSVKSYNTSLADRYRARAAMETGDKNAYNDQIKERQLSSTL